VGEQNKTRNKTWVKVSCCRTELRRFCLRDLDDNQIFYRLRNNTHGKRHTGLRLGGKGTFTDTGGSINRFWRASLNFGKSDSEVLGKSVARRKSEIHQDYCPKGGGGGWEER